MTHKKNWKLMGKFGPLIEDFCLRDLNLISLGFSWVDDPWGKLDGFVPFFFLSISKKNNE
ncbi:hypothetical protein ACE6H2_004222 [Prunus campanulata]